MESIRYGIALLLTALIAVQGQYTFSNCGSSNKIFLRGLKINPHPMYAPGFSTFELDVETLEDIVHPLKTVFDLKATAFLFTVPIKCEDGVGSCTYDDWCDVCKTCTCPVAKGRMTMNIPMNLTSTIPIGSSATVTASITFQSATGQTGCINMGGIKVQKP